MKIFQHVSDIGNLQQALQTIVQTARLKQQKQDTCRQFVVDNFNKDKNFQLYLNLYQELLRKQQ